MYISEVKATFIEALRTAFDPAHPFKIARSLNISGEFPEKETDFPGVWVSFSPDPETRSVGINHREIVVDDDGGEREVHRWRGSGRILMTVHAFSSLHRDRLVDELLRIIAFTDSSPYVARFRRDVEQNDFIGISAKWDTATIMGITESSGTPWGSSDMVYEGTIAMDIECSYFPEQMENGGGLIRISRIVAKGYVEGGPKPVFDEAGVDNHPADADDGWT